jgi:hypothetical protein
MQRDDELKDELKDVSFDRIVNKTILTPEGYFEQLPDRVVDRWNNEKDKSWSNSISIRRIMATAAVITGLCFGITWWTNQTMFRQSQSEISSDEAYQYIIEHIDDFAPILNESGQMAEENNIAIPPSNIIEEYLLEEMEDEDFESLF